MQTDTSSRAEPKDTCLERTNAVRQGEKGKGQKEINIEYWNRLARALGQEALAAVVFSDQKKKALEITVNGLKEFEIERRPSHLVCRIDAIIAEKVGTMVGFEDPSKL